MCFNLLCGILPSQKKGTTMKTIIRLILTAFLVIFAFTSNTYAEDYTKLSLPEGARARLGKGAIEGIAYSPDGTRLAVASGIGIWLYDTQTGQELNLLKEYPHGVSSVSFSPDGQIIVSGGYDTIRLWNVSTGTIIKTLSEDKSFEGGRRSSVYNVSFSPDGKTLASCGWKDKDAIIRLWDVATGRHRRTLKHSHAKHKREWVVVKSISFSPDGKTLASGSSDNSVQLWNARTGRHRRTLAVYTDNVESVSFSPDGQVLASGSGNTVRLWNVRTGDLIRTLNGHTNPECIV